jgi:hypothetical protein
MAAIGELWPPHQSLYSMPAYQKNAAWLTWLCNETPPESIIACVPFPRGVAVGEYQSITLWMYWQTFHQRRMVNGYSGFFPPTAWELKAAMAGFPNPDSLAALSQRGVTHVVADRRFIGAAMIGSQSGAPLRLQLLFSDEVGQVDVYQLR